LCGNEMIEGTEACDGAALADQTCETLGHVGGGPLACTGDCMFDETGCIDQLCGNGLVEGTEACDGEDFGGMDCMSFGYAGGLLTCTDTCDEIIPVSCLPEQEGDPCVSDNDCDMITPYCVEGFCW